MPPKKQITEEKLDAIIEASDKALEPEQPIPHIDKVQDATICVSLTRKYGNAEITLSKEMLVTPITMLDQHREYDKITQQLEWHIGRIALERLTKGAPDGQRPK